MRIDAALYRRRKLSLTSLIDVIFLLLLFFMLSSTFTRFAKVEIAGGPAAASPTTAQPDILIRLDDTGWQINGQTMSEEDAIGELSRLSESGAKKALLLVRGKLTSQMLVNALERIRHSTPLVLTVSR